MTGQGAAAGEVARRDGARVRSQPEIILIHPLRGPFLRPAFQPNFSNPSSMKNLAYVSDDLVFCLTEQAGRRDNGITEIAEVGVAGETRSGH